MNTKEIETLVTIKEAEKITKIPASVILRWRKNGYIRFHFTSCMNCFLYLSDIWNLLEEVYPYGSKEMTHHYNVMTFGE